MIKFTRIPKNTSNFSNLFLMRSRSVLSPRVSFISQIIIKKNFFYVKESFFVLWNNWKFTRSAGTYIYLGNMLHRKINQFDIEFCWDCFSKIEFCFRIIFIPISICPEIYQYEDTRQRNKQYFIFIETISLI